jgi:pimeloyl-ACP methyl ester carboxylesterase
MRRLKRWSRRIGIGLLVLFAALTLASLGYNAATSGEIRPATALYPGPFVRVGGRLVAYRAWGRSGTPIVLLGGFVVPSFVWDGVGPLLGRQHRVFALDLPPFGYTERKGPYSLRSWVELVRAFAAHFGLRHPVVVGHSLGAAVAVGMALWHPRDARRIVLLDGDAIAGSGAPAWVTDLLLSPWYTSVYRLVTSSDWIVRRALRGAFGKHAPPLTGEALEQWERPFKVKGTAAAFRSMLRYGIQGFKLADLRRVHTHATVIWGADDSVDAVSAGRKSAKALGAPFTLIAGAGHLSMLAKPHAVAHAIGRFASSIR